jgi:hypothetical protein
LLSICCLAEVSGAQKDEFLFKVKASPTTTEAGVVDLQFSLKYLGAWPIQIGFEAPIYEYCTLDVPSGWESRVKEGMVSYIMEMREPQVLKSGESIAESAPLRHYFVKIAAGEFLLHVVLNVPLGDNDQAPKLVLQTELPLKITAEQAKAFNRTEEEEKKALQRQAIEGK